MNVSKKISRIVLFIVLPIMWLLFVHITLGFSNPWIDFSINKVAEIIAKCVMIWYVSGVLLKFKDKKITFFSMAVLCSLIMAFFIPYINKIVWSFENVNLNLAAQIEIANCIYYKNDISGRIVIGNIFWFVFYVVISYIRMIKSTERKPQNVLCSE